MGKGIISHQLVSCAVILIFLHLRVAFLLPSNVSTNNIAAHPFCSHQERSALLQFKGNFIINSDASSICDILESAPYEGVGSHIYHDAKVESFPKTKNWKEGSDCCSWDGVSCDKVSGHIIQLDLSCSQLQGVLHSNSTLFQLRHLQYLNLAFNEFLGSQIPSEIGQLSELTHLNISLSGFSGEIPSEILNLSKMASLDLSMIQNFRDGSAYFKQKEVIHLNSIDILLQHLTQLQILDLDGVEVSISAASKSWLGRNLSTTPLSYPPLTYLSLFWANMSGEFPHYITSLVYLKYLNLSRCYLGNNITVGIGNLTDLEYLDLSENHLEGQIPNSLANLNKLQVLQLHDNNIIGKMPYWLSQRPSLLTLDLSHNQLVGEIFPHIGEFQSKQLQNIDLSGNNLQGINLSFISNLVNLTRLSLASNNLTVSLGCNILVGLQKLQFLDLSNNNHILLPICDKLVYSLTPKLVEFQMSTCNISAFPYFLRNLKHIRRLDLSNNKIHGPLPEWLGGMGKSSLKFLNLSHNFLTTSFEILPWDNLQEVYFSFNKLQGVLPIPPRRTKAYVISNNMLSGGIHPRICDLNDLEYVDFSNNNLSGRIPYCLSNMTSIQALNLGRNSFNGTIPKMFGGKLSMLDLSHNKLEGHIPRFLANCTGLEILDLGHNFICDTFPIWLESMPELKILILRANRFYGSLAEPRNASSFTNLGVIDLSSNKFTGNLPSNYFRRWKSMVTTRYENYLSYVDDGAYYSMTFTSKGQATNFERILTIFKAIDFSNNKFEGEIPQSIGNLRSLIVLNLSNNGLTGEIPPSLGNLVNLNSLDISNNSLSGRIPEQLNSLTSLGVFNVSQNNLEGPIPQSGQLLTFPYNSYEGNPGLCGIPLPKKCEKVQVSSFEQTKNSNSVLDGFTWKPVVMGYGCGALTGIVLGNFIIKKHEEWVMSIFNIRLLWRINISNKVERK